ncbi:hypothetical protein E2C01_045811 [Portunus trituberculatus]|uniref:Uncharacterized protein n=1 Tax=Portunus trituberculatus TaxID=210409 RepID=A0A5B7G401_PORTR|nr:hypothetical protein [Portunus trituberculatus]
MAGARGGFARYGRSSVEAGGGTAECGLPVCEKQRVAQTKWLKWTLTPHSDRFRERSDITGELRGSLCSRQGTAKF